MRETVYRVIMGEENGFWAGVLKALLWFISLFYNLAIAIKSYLYSREILHPAKLGKPVVSVGNLTWGGVGKTPFVIMLAKYIRTRGLNPAVLTRGYMSSGGSKQSDEVDMMRECLPEIALGVGVNRIRSSQNILLRGAVDVFILDDGFQHRKVERDLDIVLVDATNPFGNGNLIPLGNLREPVNALKRASIIILTKSDSNPSATQVLEERIKKINPSCVLAWGEHSPRSFRNCFSDDQEDLAVFRGKKVVSFCSIGDPANFQETLNNLGVDLKKNFIFPDHFDYLGRDIEKIIAYAQQSEADDIIMTAKDAVKIIKFKELFKDRRCWVLNVEMELHKGKEKVFERLDHLLVR